MSIFSINTYFCSFHIQVWLFKCGFYSKNLNLKTLKVSFSLYSHNRTQRENIEKVTQRLSFSTLQRLGFFQLGFEKKAL